MAPRNPRLPRHHLAWGRIIPGKTQRIRNPVPFSRRRIPRRVPALLCRPHPIGRRSLEILPRLSIAFRPKVAMPQRVTVRCRLLRTRTGVQPDARLNSRRSGPMREPAHSRIRSRRGLRNGRVPPDTLGLHTRQHH